MSLLYALARGHALVQGRRQLTVEDLPIVARAALESTPNDRRAVMRLLLANDGSVTTAQPQEALGCSAPTGRAILETLDKLGLGTLSNPGAPAPATLTLAEQLRWLLEPLKGKRRRPGDGDYLPWLYAKFEAGRITPDEWRELSGVHEALVATLDGQDEAAA